MTMQATDEESQRVRLKRAKNTLGFIFDNRIQDHDEQRFYIYY